jgi:hypothetical protein
MMTATENRTKFINPDDGKRKASREGGKLLNIWRGPEAVRYSRRSKSDN